MSTTTTPPPPGTTDLGDDDRSVPRRRRLRLVLLLAGIVPALVAVAFLAKVALMLSHDGAGREAFDDGDHPAAAGEFAANDRLNWFESWIAPFDEGAARHADGDFGDALVLYDAALEDVPGAEECTVRINQALAHESIGDTALEDGDPQAATESWQAGIDALTAGDCPTDSGRGEDQTRDAAAVEQRLEDKLQEQQQQEQKQDGKDDKKDKQQPEQKDPKEKKLEERNDRGIEEKQDYDDTQNPGGSGYQW